MNFNKGVGAGSAAAQPGGPVRGGDRAGQWGAHSVHGGRGAPAAVCGRSGAAVRGRRGEHVAADHSVQGDHCAAARAGQCEGEDCGQRGGWQVERWLVVGLGLCFCFDTWQLFFTMRAI